MRQAGEGSPSPLLPAFSTNDLCALDLSSMQPSSLGIKPPPNDAYWGNANHCLIDWIIRAKKGISSCLDCFGDPSNLDSTWRPWRQDIIDHQRDMGIVQDVAKLLTPTEILSPNVDHILLRIIAEPNWRDLGF